MPDDFVAVYRAIDEATANIVRAVLEDAGVPAVVRRYHSSWFDGLFVVADGAWGEILVPVADADRAREVLDKY
ncbi:MAG TPA: DUF2007 domain-containing protein [Armatimonadota bacterium]|nr:DUF2007 domain-containing protein [Armatimonadota bacterium]